jgi:hypothetical protein
MITILIIVMILIQTSTFSTATLLSATRFAKIRGTRDIKSSMDRCT